MATVLRFESIEIYCMPLPEGALMCRLGTPGDQPERVNDGYYPNADLGFLWLRWVDGHLACSGMIRDGAIDRSQLDALLEHIDARALRSDHQIDYQVVFVSALATHVESGEESLRY